MISKFYIPEHRNIKILHSISQWFQNTRGMLCHLTVTYPTYTYFTYINSSTILYIISGVQPRDLIRTSITEHITSGVSDHIVSDQPHQTLLKHSIHSWGYYDYSPSSTILLTCISHIQPHQDVRRTLASSISHYYILSIVSNLVWS
jgi:hypothetical protein